MLRSRWHSARRSRYAWMREGPRRRRKAICPTCIFLLGELGTAREGGQVVGNGLGRVVHDLADLRGGLALESEADDLSAMGEYRPEVMERAAHRDQDVGVCLAHDLQVAGDGSRGDEEDAVGEVFGGEQRSLTEGLLAEVEESRLAKAGRSVLHESNDRRPCHDAG